MAAALSSGLVPSLAFPKSHGELKVIPRPEKASPVPALSEEELADPQAMINAASKKDAMRVRAFAANKEYRGINEQDADGRSTLMVAALKKLPEDVCIAILKHPKFDGFNVTDRWDNTALTLAASNGLSNVCQAIISSEEFTSINQKDKWGATCLHWAADCNLGPVCAAIVSHPRFIGTHQMAFSFRFENKTALQVAEERGNKQAADAIRSNTRY